MTTLDTHAPAGASDVSVAGRGASVVADWITTTDHKRIGRMFLLPGLVFSVAAGVLGVLLGIDRADTGSALIRPGAVAQVFYAYRYGLVFCGVAAVVVGMAVAVVPLQLGARSLAFPRLAATGLWFWLTGSVVVLVSLLANGGPGGGNSPFVALFVTGHLLQVLGLLAAVVSLVTSILTTRAPGMNLRRVPPYTWSVLVAGISALLVLPVIAGRAVVTYLDYRYGRTALGGNAGISSMVGLGITQPATYMLAIPAFGLLLETVTTTVRRRLPLRGVAFAGIGLLGVGALATVTATTIELAPGSFHASFGTWLEEALPLAFFYVLPVIGGVVVLGIAALALQNGKLRLLSPTLFAAFGAGLALVGLVGTVVQGAGDAHLVSTVFEESMMLYVVYGALLAMLGAANYWGPKLTGRTVDDRKVAPLAVVGAVGVVLAALPYAIAGFAKQPGMTMVFDYSGPKGLWNVLSAIGHVLVALTVLGVLALRLNATRSGAPAGDDPWDAQTLEWATSSPPPPANFADVHTVMSPEPLLDLKPGGQI